MDHQSTPFDIIGEYAPQFVYGAIAVLGGIARYLNSYVNGRAFRFGILCASAFVAGFSGWIFSEIGTALGLHQPVLYVLAGVGGFFSEQTMKYALEWAQNRAPTGHPHRTLDAR